MSLPLAVTNIATDVACVGPFRSSAGNIYFVGKSTVNATRLRAMKSADPSTTSFAQAGTDPQPVSGINPSHISAVQNGDTLHIAVGVGVTTTYSVWYYTFDMSTDTWSSSEAVSAAHNIQSTGGSTLTGCSIVRRSDGSMVVFYMGLSVTNMGTLYNRVSYARRASGGGWTSDIAVGAAGTVNEVAVEAVLGGSDRVHFFWYDWASAGTFHRTLNSSNVLQTASTKNTTVANPRQAVSYNSSGTQKVALITSNGRVLYFDSADTPTLNASGVSVSSPTEPYRIFNDVTDVWALCGQVAGAVAAAKSTDHGATYAAKVTANGVSTGANEYSDARDGNIYARGSNYVIAGVYAGSSSGLYYDEYAARVGDVTAPTITSSATPSVAENAVLSHSLTADETVTWAIRTSAQDGASVDYTHFEISGSTLRWLSNGTKDYEAPGDTGTNNTYVVVVRATDLASNTTDQTITVTVTDVSIEAVPRFSAVLIG